MANASPSRGTIRRGRSGAYIVDYVSFADKLIVELDGPQCECSPANAAHFVSSRNETSHCGIHVTKADILTRFAARDLRI
jgi:hypothetical protein